LDFDSSRGFRKLFKVVNGVETTWRVASLPVNVKMSVAVKVFNGQIHVGVDGQELFGGPVADTALHGGARPVFLKSDHVDDPWFANYLKDNGPDQVVADADANGSEPVSLEVADRWTMTSFPPNVWAALVATGMNRS
jgi:hypothetical protein